MQPIKIYNDQLHQLIALHQVDEEKAYDYLEEKLNEGHMVIFYTSFFYPNDPPAKVFEKTEDFKEWRRQKKEYNTQLQDLFNPEI